MGETVKITIVGCGALGSHLVPLLRNEDVEINVVDFDRIETKNVSSQFHGRNHVGKLKTISLQQVMDFMFKRKITTNTNKLTKDNDITILKGSGLLIDCLDNAEARTLVQNYARASNTACLHGALAADGAFGRVIWDKDFKIDSEGSAGAPTCEDGNHLAFISLVASYMARSVHVFLEADKMVGFSISPMGAVVV